MTVSSPVAADASSTQTATAAPIPAFVNMFGNTAAPPMTVSAPVADDDGSKQTATAAPSPAFFNMFGSSAVPRAPRQPVTHDAAGASVVLPATLMNAEEVSPQPVTYGPPALGVC